MADLDKTNRRNSSLGNQMDLVNRMVARWGSMGGDEIDLDEVHQRDSDNEDSKESIPSNADINTGLDGGQSQEWTDADLTLLQSEMQAAMFAIVEPLQQKVTIEEQFHDEMERRLKEKPDFMDPSNAMQWSEYEVVQWLQNMQMERYERSFREERVDGPMLLEDITQYMLETNLAVRTIHARKIMREIDNLKRAVRGVTDKLLDESDFVCTHSFEDMEKKIENVQMRRELEKAKRAKEKLKEFYEKELTKLGQQIIDLQDKMNSKKKKKKNSRSNSKIVLPVPPTFNEDVDAIGFGMGVSTIPSASPLPGISEEQFNEMKAINESLQSEVDRLQRENGVLNERRKESRKQTAALEKTNAELLKKQNTLELDNVKLQENVRRLMNDAAGHKEEQKEAQTKIAELEKRVRELAVKALMPSEFMQWNQSQIHLWIMSLEQGRFKKYESDLMNALTRDEVIGEDLLDVTPLVLKAWGIKDRKDRKGLNDQIQRLVQQNGPQEAAQIAFAAPKMDEGAPTAFVG